MRDKSSKDLEYFEKFISESENSISKFQNWIDTGKTPPERIPIIYRSIGSKKLRSIVAKYSVGNSIDEIRLDYLNLLICFNKYWPEENVKYEMNGRVLQQYIDYDDMLWMLSFGYLLNVSAEEFSNLVVLIDRDNVRDYLYEFIIRAKIKDRPMIYQESYEYGWKLYSSIRKALFATNSNEAIELIYDHLNYGWKKDHEESLLRAKSSQNLIHYGNWSFESAAVTTILGLDDSKYRNCTFYPADLVEYYDARTE